MSEIDELRRTVSQLTEHVNRVTVRVNELLEASASTEAKVGELEARLSGFQQLVNALAAASASSGEDCPCDEDCPCEPASDSECCDDCPCDEDQA